MGFSTKSGDIQESLRTTLGISKKPLTPSRRHVTMPITQVNTSRSTGNGDSESGQTETRSTGSRRRKGSSDRGGFPSTTDGQGFGLRSGIRSRASARDPVSSFGSRSDRRLSRRPRRSSDRWDGDRERCFGPAHCYGKLVNRWLHRTITNCSDAHKAALVKQRSHMRTARRAHARRAVINTIGTDSTPEQVDSGGSTSNLMAPPVRRLRPTSPEASTFSRSHRVSVKEIVSGHELGVARHAPRVTGSGRPNQPCDGPQRHLVLRQIRATKISMWIPNTLPCRTPQSPLVARSFNIAARLRNVRPQAELQAGLGRRQVLEDFGFRSVGWRSASHAHMRTVPAQYTPHTPSDVN